MDIETIVAEIITLEPALAHHRAELKKLVTELLIARPDVTIDRAFVTRLREQLIERATAHRPSLFSFLTSPALRYAGAGALTTTILIVPAMWYVLDAAPTTHTTTAGTQIARLGTNGFGALNIQPTGAGGGGAMMTTGARAMNESVASSDISVSVPAAAPAVDAKRMPGVLPIATDMTRMMIAPGEPNPNMPPFEATTYRYAFDGILPAITKTTTVYRREKTLPLADEKTIEALGGGLVDLSRFTHLTLQNLAVVEDKKNGFAVNISPDGISINQNYERWANPLAMCRDDACTQQNRIKIEQIPSNEKTIAAAKSFITTYGIDVSSYGTPVVDTAWRRDYDASTDKENYYLPEQINVIYPTLIDGKEIREEWNATPAGLTISIDVRTGRGVAMNGLTPQTYTAADYASADGDLLKRAIEKGGQATYTPEGATVKTIDVTLGTPSVELVKMWVYDQKTGTGSELYVPSLIFPVTRKPADQSYFQNTIIIPLPSDILTKRMEAPSPMLMKSGVAAPMEVVAPASASTSMMAAPTADIETPIKQ